MKADVAEGSRLRRYAVARTLFAATTLGDAVRRLGFVQADPIRAPARAQDLTLRHRVRDYRAGDLERRYARHALEEDFFVNYGFLPRPQQALMHPRSALRRWDARTRARADALLAFIAERGIGHPRELDRHFDHGRVRNYWGGQSSATTHLLDGLHYRGHLRVLRREQGVRVYALAAPRPVPAGEDSAHVVRTRVDALVDLVVQAYAPLPARSLAMLVRRLRYAAPQWHAHIPAALVRARLRLAHARVDGLDWYWPKGEDPAAAASPAGARARLLAPFDPIVWDRLRFELLWQWTYRFEAYTPPARRRLGYYALPLLWDDRVIGWANASVTDGVLAVDVGYVRGRPPAGRVFARELESDVDRMRAFLGAERHRLGVA